MNEHENIAREKFIVLLEHIKIIEPEKLQYFKEAEITKVIVNQQERTWHFKFFFAKIIPADICREFLNHLKSAFNDIASVTWEFLIADQKSSAISAGVLSYWQLILEDAELLVTIFGRNLLERALEIKDNKLIITLMSDAEESQFKNKYFGAIKKSYEKFGFKDISIETKVDTFAHEKNLEIFQEEKQKEDAKLAELTKKHHENKEAAHVTPKEDELAIKIGKDINSKDLKTLDLVSDEDKLVAVEGVIFQREVRVLKNGKSILALKITDYTESLLIKMFSKDKTDELIFSKIKVGMWVRVQGNPQMDTFNRFNPEIFLMANRLVEIKKSVRKDMADEGQKRVELHVHSQMSQMDATVPITDFIERAALWGHKAIAVTDHGSVQAFPEAYNAAKKHGIKVIYGLEAYLVDDDVLTVYNADDSLLDELTFVVFDVETTGLSAVSNTIIELGAVKVRNGKIIDEFSKFINPHHALSATTIKLTGITDQDLAKAPDICEVLQSFKEWTSGTVLVAHNASFDLGFLNIGYKKCGLKEVTTPVLDTLELARNMYPEFKRFSLDALAKKFDVKLDNHHRAIYDAIATSSVFIKMLLDLSERRVTSLNALNHINNEKTGFRNARPKHCTILVQNAIGLKNLFKLVSLAHTKYFHRVPRILRSDLIKYREGLLIGSSCDKGELIESLINKPFDEALSIADFYDFLEVFPPQVYAPLIQSESVSSMRDLEELVKNVIKVGDKLNKLVVATGNAHYLDEKDKIYRQILINSQAGNPLNRFELPSVHFRTTDEILSSFTFLKKEKAEEIVITNTNKLADMIDDVKPIKDKLYVPKIDGSDVEVREIAYKRAHELYGTNLPEIIVFRIEKELKSVIGHGFAVIYLISQKLVKKSLEDGYVVGSRGSVGSSLLATLMEITEVNPLSPHYLCASCTFSEFFVDGSVSSGYDLPDKLCPNCKVPLKKDGHDIPFETFLGFKGDKVPDIDLNFSGDYQAVAHDYTKELFGEDYVFRAGTIATVADKTAYGYTRGFIEENNLTKRNVEIERLATGVTGAKRTTGQHPGGIIVIPDYMDVYDFTPIQYPADNTDSSWKTTHFDFHSIHDNILKLDILGHDDPTVIRMLEDLTGIKPKDIPIDDPKVMGIFQSPEPLGVTASDINCKTGTLGVPEFGTPFVRQMLEATKPTCFSDLVQISGLSHGTDVWLKNSQELIDKGICTLKDVIGCRDDIMVDLIYQGIEPSLAFKIMESVRKGKGLTLEMEAEMKKNGVTSWYIESCKKIKYMFPKAHAAAYVMMAVRIAYFKVHMPIHFYAAYFSVRASDFDIDAMVKGALTLKEKLSELVSKGHEASAKEKSLQTVLEVAYEMCQRGFSFQKIDLYRSDAYNFIIDGNSLIPPFIAIPGLGENVAEQIIKARQDGEFLSKEDLSKRGKISTTIMQFMENHGCLKNMQEKNQLSFFDIAFD